MKNIFYFILLVAQIISAQEDFDKGNKYYQKGNYNQAIKAYESILNKNKHSADLYFNLGNCYYKINQVAPSIYYYEKALILNPDDKEILNNLKFAHKLQIDEIKEVPKVGFEKLIRDFTSTFNYNTWAWISVIFAVLFLLFFVGYYFSQTTFSKRTFFFGMFAVLFFVLISILSAVFENAHFESEKPAIVFSEVVTVKNEPKASGSDVVVLHEGTKVYVQESLSNWKKIVLTDGTAGWIENEAIKEIK